MTLGDTIVSGLHSCWCRVNITSFTSIQVVITSPALYKKKDTPEMFEINYIFVRPNLDVLIDICKLPDQYKNES